MFGCARFPLCRDLDMHGISVSPISAAQAAGKHVVTPYNLILKLQKDGYEKY